MALASMIKAPALCSEDRQERSAGANPGSEQERRSEE